MHFMATHASFAPHVPHAPHVHPMRSMHPMAPTHSMSCALMSSVCMRPMRPMRATHSMPCVLVPVCTAGVWASLAPVIFNSPCAALLGGPLLLGVMPVLAPVLAVANIFNPEVPLVSWR